MAEEHTPEHRMPEPGTPAPDTPARRGSAFQQAAAADSMSHALLAAMGGWRGLVEALLPGVAFLILFATTPNLWWAVGIPAALGLLFVLVRLVRREPVTSALGGLAALILSGFFALRSGQGEQFFLVGFWINAIYAAVFLVSMLVRWPLIGVLTGFLVGEGTSWRRRPRILLWMQIATGAWIAFFVLRLAVQLPLYFAGAVGPLGIAHLVMGLPLFAVFVVLTVLFVRAVLSTAATKDAGASEDAGGAKDVAAEKDAGVQDADSSGPDAAATDSRA